MIRQVWMNLIGNALKFTKGREIAEIEIGAREAGEGEWNYYIKDNGVGFDMRFVDKLFGVFQRLHSQQEFPGTGVGLALVQRVVERHGGRVWAEAEVDHGATFSFTLPNPK
jgi:light-regulated signal transduction histidine kinase (bacteriophytochrome)